MSKLKSDIIHCLSERGYIHQCTDLEALDTLCSSQPIIGYIGFDATATSLHVGSLVMIMMLRKLKEFGHKPLPLLGGGTTKIGDPSGKDTSRKMLSSDDIQNNIKALQPTFHNFLGSDVEIIDNSAWLDELNYLDFLREYGTHFSVNRMLTFDSVKLRLEREQPLSFLEFNYMILQAYDFLELYKRYGCTLQLGGSDQWGNIVNGVELTRRVLGKTVYGLTTPLITTSSGEKMGKTASGAIWLNANQLSAYDYWQYWRNVHDQDVGRFLKLFTDLPISEITKLEALRDNEINEAKKILADEATKLCHGQDAVLEARQTAEKLFEQHSMTDLSSLPVIEVSNLPAMVLDLFVDLGFSESKGEARRLIRGGGAKINDSTISDENLSIDIDSFKDGDIKLSAGKKRHGLIRLAASLC